MNLYAVKTREGVEIKLHDCWPRHLVDVSGHLNAPGALPCEWPKVSIELAVDTGGRQARPYTDWAIQSPTVLKTGLWEFSSI
jgi:hypothetical protein